MPSLPGGVAASPRREGRLPKTSEQILRDEQRRIARERWLHFMLAGLAVSVLIHVGILVRMGWIKLASMSRNEEAPVQISLAPLPETVEQPFTEAVELPDPSPRAAGIVSDELDPNPNLSSDLASGNPDENSYGMIEAPGVGAIVGPGGPGGGIGIGSGKGGGGTSFFGVGGRGSRFAYIVDVSGSMEQENRMVTAIAELKRSLNALPDYAQFYVVLYSAGAIRPDFELDGWLKATRANKNRMFQWLDLQSPRGGTFPLEAFDIVFKLPQPPDVIFFLTDGEIPGETIYHVDNYARDLKHEVILNTIGFSSEAGQAPLIELAKRLRGVFRFVPAQGSGLTP